MEKALIISIATAIGFFGIQQFFCVLIGKDRFRAEFMPETAAKSLNRAVFMADLSGFIAALALIFFVLLFIIAMFA